MIIAGGIYREECVVPSWSRIFGSGGRAAIVLSHMCSDVSLFAYASRHWIEDAYTSLNGFRISTQIVPIDADIAFHYFHPMSTPDLIGLPNTPMAPLEARGDALLRFGFVEGNATVHAGRCVFDPQNSLQALQFRENGSTAETLAVVLNEAELRESTGSYGRPGAQAVRDATGAEVVVVKRGPRGADVYTAVEFRSVPARLTPEVFKIGSGDVFTAVFAYHWAERKMDAFAAAELASCAAARYVMTRDLASASVDLDLPPAPNQGPSGPIYLAAPFFNLAQRWMVEQARDALNAVGAQVFSPLHDVGVAGSAHALAQADLDGLRDCKAVLAIIDGEDAGTLFEVGYARSRGIPVVALAENPRPETLTMVEGSGCQIARDLTTAVYRSVWAALA